ncbi:MAG: hypothetical protein WCE61_01000 [Candidatus Acidiferrum sp.]
MNEKGSSPISRREFARRAAIVSAVSLIPPGTSATYSAEEQSSPQQPSGTPSLSPESQAEADARYQSILAAYSGRFSEAQKIDLRRLCFLAQVPLDHLRAYDIENGDSPALYLKPLMERERPSVPAVISRKAVHPAKKR